MFDGVHGREVVALGLPLRLEGTAIQQISETTCPSQPATSVDISGCKQEKKSHIGAFFGLLWKR